MAAKSNTIHLQIIYFQITSNVPTFPAIPVAFCIHKYKAFIALTKFIHNLRDTRIFIDSQIFYQFKRNRFQRNCSCRSNSQWENLAYRWNPQSIRNTQYINTLANRFSNIQSKISQKNSDNTIPIFWLFIFGINLASPNSWRNKNYILNLIFSWCGS